MWCQASHCDHSVIGEDSYKDVVPGLPLRSLCHWGGQLQGCGARPPTAITLSLWRTATRMWCQASHCDHSVIGEDSCKDVVPGLPLRSLCHCGGQLQGCGARPPTAITLSLGRTATRMWCQASHCDHSVIGEDNYKEAVPGLPLRSLCHWGGQLQGCGARPPTAITLSLGRTATRMWCQASHCDHSVIVEDSYKDVVPGLPLRSLCHWGGQLQGCGARPPTAITLSLGRTATRKWCQASHCDHSVIGEDCYKEVISFVFV